MAARSRRFPTKAQVRDGIIWPCTRSTELRRAGLGDYELKVQFVFWEDEDEDDGEVIIMPATEVYARVVGKKKWTEIGCSAEGFKFAFFKTGTMALMKWINDLCDKYEDVIGEELAPEIEAMYSPEIP
jgi:hypothetical protein